MVFAQPRHGPNGHVVQRAGSSDGGHSKRGAPVGPAPGQPLHGPLAVHRTIPWRNGGGNEASDRQGRSEPA